MKLEDQVAPLALAQRMKELGFPQDTAFSWYVRRDPAGAVIEDGHPRLRLSDGAQVVEGAYDVPPGYEGSHIRREQLLVKWELRHECAAPTVAEMGEWLPASIVDDDDHPAPSGPVVFGLHIEPVQSMTRRWLVRYHDEDNYNSLDECDDLATGSEAESRALVLMRLAETGHVIPPRTAPTNVMDVKSDDGSF